VACAGKGVLILGKSGAGKSALALQLLALGAGLVADDQTEIVATGPKLLARAPDTIKGLIEARGVGILRLPFLPSAEIALVIDLDQTESERLPPQRSVTLLGIACDLVLGSRHTHFPASILCYLHGSRSA
jgi:HPr kinase/phosphorylase